MLHGKFLYLAILFQVTYLVCGQDQSINTSNGKPSTPKDESYTEVIKSMQKQIDRLEGTVSHLNESLTLLLEVMLSNTLNQKKILNEQTKAQEKTEQLIQKIISIQKKENTFLATESQNPLIIPLKKDDYDEHFNIKKIITNNQILPENCAEIMKYEDSTNQPYALEIHQNGLERFGAYCERHNDKTGWMIIQRRKDGSVSFNKDWNNYKNGFGDLFGEYWLGLERLHKITQKKKYELWIQLESYDNGTRYARYSEFSVGSESDGYSLNISGYTGDAGDALSAENGHKFTTIDNDHDDNYDDNIAQLRKGGWWYFTWNYNNLNGEYKPYAKKNENSMEPGEYGIYWSEWLDLESLKYVHMAIKPIE